MSLEKVITYIESVNSEKEIVKTQTTYLDFISVSQTDVAADPKTIRIHFDIAYERSLKTGKFDRFGFLDEHPLLIEYYEPIVRVQLVSAVRDKAQFREILERTARKVFDNWRLPSNYMFMPLDDFLKKDYGILMEAPISYASALEELVNKDVEILRLQDSWHKLGPNWKNHKPMVLLLDDWYVIAESFKAEFLGQKD